jgi:hypothetical protein
VLAEPIGNINPAVPTEKVPEPPAGIFMLPPKTDACCGNGWDDHARGIITCDCMAMFRRGHGQMAASAKFS